MIRKVTSSLFDDAKKLLAVHTSQREVAEILGISTSTIGMISRCDLYEDYLELLNDRIRGNDDKLRAMGLSGLTGEPLFWKVHSECKGFSIPNIASWSGLSQDEVRKMRQALDYQDYLKTNGKENNMRGRKPAVTQQGFDEVKQFLKDGYSDSDIIRLFGITEYCLTRIKRADSYQVFKGHRTSDQAKIWVNDGLKEVILDGNKAHVPIQQIAKELGLSLISVERIIFGDHKTRANLITLGEYINLKNHPKLIRRPRLREAVQKAKNYKDFSIRYYTNAEKVSWENKGKEITNISNEVERPEEAIRTCDLGRAGTSIEANKELDKSKPEIDKSKDNTDKLLECVDKLLASDEKKYAFQKYKYRGIFILLGEFITGLIALGLIALLK